MITYPGYIEILPVNPAYLDLPTYDPFVVFSRPVGGIVVTAAITFGRPILVTPALCGLDGHTRHFSGHLIRS